MKKSAKVIAILLILLLQVHTIWAMHEEQKPATAELMHPSPQRQIATVKIARAIALKPGPLYQQALQAFGLHENDLNHFEIDILFSTAQQDPESYVFKLEPQYLKHEIVKPQQIMQAMRWINQQTKNKKLIEIAERLSAVLEQSPK